MHIKWKMDAVVVVSILLTLFLFLLLRLVYLVVFNNISSSSVSLRTRPCKTLVILGSGGHTAEMLKLLSGVNLSNYNPRTYVVASTDRMSAEKVRVFEESVGCSTLDVRIIPRARRVGQSWLTTPLTTLYSILRAMTVVCACKPELVLCNGPGTCIPICFWAFLLKFCFLTNTKVVYVESVCRVQQLSLSGLLLYYFADGLLVQWPQLKQKYPRTSYLGRLV